MLPRRQFIRTGTAMFTRLDELDRFADTLEAVARS
jgi:hypothetical protein